jgi:hypothetical protein
MLAENLEENEAVKILAKLPGWLELLRMTGRARN